MKEWLEIPEVFAELFNGAVFRGEHRIDSSNLKERNVECVVSLTNKEGQELYRQKFRDVVNMCDSELGMMVLAVENQSDICNIMPVRNMMYDAMMYEKNVRDIVAENEKEDKKVHVTRVIEKNQKIHPLITLVLYTGKDKWDGPDRLSEMWNISDETKEILKNELNDYKIHIIDANHMSQKEIDKYNSNVRQFFYVLNLLKQERSLKNVEEDIVVKYSRTAKAIGIVRNRKEYNKLVKNKEGVINMKQIEDIWYEEGEEKGKQIGKQIGEQSGKQKYLIGVVCKKLDKNKTPEVIADELEEELDVINNICSVAGRFAPKYDVEEIYDMLREETEYGE